MAIEGVSIPATATVAARSPGDRVVAHTALLAAEDSELLPGPDVEHALGLPTKAAMGIRIRPVGALSAVHVKLTRFTAAGAT
jgi:hypothetical protein